MGSILRLAVEALQQAIELRSPLPGLVHHSDRGIQYASSDYVALLKEHGIVPSMSRPANPYDNASCESFMKTLKREEIYANEYLDLDDLRNHIEEFIERYYNQKRLHSALNFSALADEFGIRRTVLYDWQQQLWDAAADLSTRAAMSPVRELRQQVRERNLKRALGKNTVKVDLF